MSEEPITIDAPRISAQAAALAARGRHHQHYCPGCDHAWSCRNTACTDLPAQWCRKWCLDVPPALRLPSVLEAIGHQAHQLAHQLEREGEPSLAALAMVFRETILARVAALAAGLEARQ